MKPITEKELITMSLEPIWRAILIVYWRAVLRHNQMCMHSEEQAARTAHANASHFAGRSALAASKLRGLL